jgi:hypothetical protein
MAFARPAQRPHSVENTEALMAAAVGRQHRPPLTPSPSCLHAGQPPSLP